jgi:hypothetical protein
LSGSGGGFGRGRGGEGRGAYHGLVCAHGRGREARDGVRRYLPLELRLRWRGRRQCVQRHRVVVWGRVKLLGRLVGGGRAGISDLAVVHRGRAARQPAHGQQATFISGQLSSLPSRRRGRARLNSPVRRRPWQARLVGNRATDSWAARDGRTARHALLGDGPRS